MSIDSFFPKIVGCFVLDYFCRISYNYAMKYQTENQKIIVFDKNEFNPKHILECGQIFRYKNIKNNDYVVYSLDKKAEIFERPDCYEIITNDVSYFENFFDLKNDYSVIKSKLKSNPTLKDAVEFGYGIRILNQSPIETIFSFIISANNNIKRIQTLVEKLSQKCGTDMGDFYAFPTLEQIQSQSIQDLRDLGMGFRAKYIFETAKKLDGFDLESLRNFDTQKQLDFLTSLSGVGPKVADCIALFAYHNMYCFPVDTWVQKIYNEYFNNTQIQGQKQAETNRVKIRKNLVAMFDLLSGYAQQYLFYYKRELDTKQSFKS